MLFPSREIDYGSAVLLERGNLIGDDFLSLGQSFAQDTTNPREHALNRVGLCRNVRIHGLVIGLGHVAGVHHETIWNTKSSMTLARRSIADLTADTVAHAITQCFEGYIVPMRMTGEQYERRFRSEHLDPYASAVWFDGEAPAVIALVCRRGGTSRVGAFGVATALRGKGLAKPTMNWVIAEARARGDRHMVLEVIEGNDRAMRLYESLGFARLRRLVGYDWAPPSLAPSRPSVQELDPLEAAQLMSQFADADLPWQLHPAGFYTLATPTRAFALENAAVVVVDASSAGVRIRGLAVDRLRRRSGLGRALLEGVTRILPSQRWSLPAMVPDGLAPEFLARLGWRLSTLSQQEMKLSIA
jgi:GNAT superfamily N-acetyltransferase